MTNAKPTTPPICPTCGQKMPYYGDARGHIHCEWKLLRRDDGWIENREHLPDRRLSDAHLAETIAGLPPGPPPTNRVGTPTQTRGSAGRVRRP
jgi:hypothetical protein